jgi:hypothetical protein
MTTTAINAWGFTANWGATTVGVANNYYLDVSTNAGFTSFVTGYQNKLLGTATTTTVTGLTPFTTYYWRVRCDKTSVTGHGGYITQTVTTIKEPLNVTSTSGANNFNLLTNAAIVVDPNVTVTFTQNITGFSVTISTGKQDADVLAYTGSLPAGVTATAYNSSTGVLSFSGTTSAANWQALLRTVTFRAYKNGTGSRKITFSAGTLNSFSNGHFYQFFASTGSWTTAKAAAAAAIYQNYGGYLATVSSQAENDYIKQILSADAWMGASDEFTQINAATGVTTFANQGASEGKWYWVTGPEAGTQLSSTNTPATPVNGAFNNWYSGEPNNAAGIEHYAQFYSTYNGQWNDLANSYNLGYIVEYGGLSSDIIQTPSYTATMNVAAVEPGNALNFNGKNTFVNIPDNSNLRFTSNYTIEAWIKPDSLNFLAGIVSKYQSGGSNGFTLRLSLTAPYSGINFDELNTANGILTTGKWYHIAAVNNAGTRTLYVNGVNIPLTGTPITISSSNTDSIRIGADFASTSNGRYFKGNIDEVRIWNTARSQAQIIASMNGPLLPSTANLLAYYNANQFTPSGANTGLSTIYDQTTNLNNATLNNFGLTGNTTNWVESYAMVVPTTTAATRKYSLGFTANWTASTIGTAEKYYLDVSTDSTFGTFVSGYNAKDVGAVTSYSVTGLSANTKYYYRVRAEKASVTGSGCNSNITSVTTNVPETLVATAGTNRTSTSFRANWSTPPIHSITSYTLDVSTNNTFTAPVTGSPFTVADTTYNVTGLTANTTYFYRVRVTNYNNSNSITTNTNAPFASISSNKRSVCLNGTAPIITFKGWGSNAPYTFTYRINGGANNTITTLGTDTAVSVNLATTTAGIYTYTLVSVTDAYNGTNAQTESVSDTVRALPTPSFTANAGLNVCSGATVTYTTVTGQTNYLWTISGVSGTDYTITAGGTDTASTSVSLKWLTAGSKSVSINYKDAYGCTTVTATTTATTVAATPTVAAITGTTTTTVGLSTILANATANGVWSSSNTANASIDSTGRVTAVGQGTTTISYTVTTGACTNVATAIYTVNAAPMPTITSFTPSSGFAGVTVTLTGTGFAGAYSVKLNGVPATFNVVSNTSITLTIPTGATTGTFTVTSAGGTATSASSFTINSQAAPTITSFTPTSAGAGSTVTITGTNFTNANAISFGATSVVSYTVVSATQITAIIGAGTTGSASVTTPGGTATLAGFTYLTCSVQPTVDAGAPIAICAVANTPINITMSASSSNNNGLLWSSDGTGTFANNNTSSALTATTYLPSAADTVTGYVNLILTAIGNSGCLNSTSTKLIRIDASSVGGTITGATNICSGSIPNNLTLIGNKGIVSKWQYATDNNFTTPIDIASTSSVLNGTSNIGILLASRYYRAVVTNGLCADALSSTATIRTLETGTWTGRTNSNAANADNWCGGVPLSNSNIIIESSNNKPTLTNNIIVNNITLNDTLYLGGYKLTLNGAISGTNKVLSGSNASAIAYAGSGATTLTFDQTTDGNILNPTSGTNSLKDLITTGTGTLTLANKVNLFERLSVGVGTTFNTGDSLVLRSIAGTNTNNTAYVDVVGGTINGQVRVERYIHKQYRGWRAITAPVTNVGISGTVKNNWQNSWGLGTNYGTRITGPSATNGLDDVSLNASLMTYNSTTGTWNKISNTNTEIIAGNSGSADNKSFFLYVRGDRTVTPNGYNPFSFQSTTLAARGKLQTGTQVFTFTGAANKSWLVGNPYACPVDLSTVTFGGSVPNQIYVWDPNRPSSYSDVTGAYVTFDRSNNWSNPYPTSGSCTKYLQSSQCFFIVPTTTTASVTFKESDKNTSNQNNQTAGIGNGIVDVFNVKLSYVKADGSKSEIDGIRAKFGDSYSAMVDAEDAYKWTTAGVENLSLSRNSASLVIEARPYITTTDTLFLNITNLAASSNYEFKMNPINFDASVSSCKLVDKFLNTETPISLTNTTLVSFNVTSVAGSNAVGRFYVVFNAAGSLPTSNSLTVKAYKQNNNSIKIDWEAIAENNIKTYTVEKSTDAASFSKLSEATAKNGNTTNAYSIVDNNPVIGVNYYRIQSIQTNNNKVYSTIVRVEMSDKGIKSITVYPNPVKSTTNMIGLQMNNLTAGNYTAVLYNTAGQQVWMKTMNHNGNNGSTSLQLNKTLASGTYQLQLTDNKGNSYQQTVLVVE